MYESFQTTDFDYNIDYDLEEINDQDSGNDFEKVIRKNEPVNSSTAATKQ